MIIERGEKKVDNKIEMVFVKIECVFRRFVMNWKTMCKKEILFIRVQSVMKNYKFYLE